MAQNQIVGAIKIKDGLFIGDEYASQDQDFIKTNKVTHIINCAASQIANRWANQGIKYLSFEWLEQDNEVLFDEKGEIVNRIYSFIEECFQLGESCLVHSVRGQSRSCCVLAAYFMKKYSWTLYKTLEYLNSRRPDLEIRASFFYQLNALESRMAKQGTKRTASWNELSDDTEHPHEELIIRNTYLNSHNGPVDEIYTNLQAKLTVLGRSSSSRLKWRDQLPQHNKENPQLATIVYSGSPDFLPVRDLLHLKELRSAPILKGAEPKKPPNPYTQLNKPHISQNVMKSLQSVSTQSNSQVRSASSKSQQGDQEQHTQQQPSQIFNQGGGTSLTNNPSFHNLLLHCALKSRTPSQQENLKKQLNQQINNNFLKPPLQQDNTPSNPQNSALRSNSLNQQEENKKQELNRPNSVKQKDSQNTSVSNFQEFKNQVQQSLNYFNKQFEAMQNLDSSNNQIKAQPQQQSSQQLQQKSKLDQLISPTIVQHISSTKHSEIQRTLSQSISQLQSSYQKFQQLQMKSQMKQTQSTAQIQKDNVYSSSELNNANKTVDFNQIQNLTPSTSNNIRSVSVPKKQDELEGKNRPNSADVKDPPRPSSKEKKESLSPFSKEPQSKIVRPSGPPLPQSSSQLYLRNVQCRRQAASTLRNQQKPNNSFQDKYLNQSANQAQNNSSFNNNSNSAIEVDNKQKLQQQQQQLQQQQQQQQQSNAISDLNQFKKLISPQSLTKSQASFQKNQPVRVLQELTEKTKQIRKQKEGLQSTSFTLVQKPGQTVNPSRTFSPALKSDHSKGKLGTASSTNVRHKIRNSSPGLPKEQDSNQSLQNMSATLQAKPNWKML